MARTECARRYLSADLPPWRTVYGYFAAWRDDGTQAWLHDALRAQARAAGQNPRPRPRSDRLPVVRAADTVPRAARGRDAATRVDDRKRHVAGDAMDLRLAVVVTAASVHDHDDARPLLWNLRRACRRIHLIWADSGYQAGRLHLGLQVVRRPDGLTPPGTAAPPGRGRSARLDRRAPPHCPRLRAPTGQPRTMITWAMIALMARRLA